MALALSAFSIAQTSPVLCFSLYLTSFICDELDGRFARMFDQTSTLGAVLDMVTDRVATSCLLAVLSSLYPSAQFMLLPLLMLDIFSHWFQMYASLAMGAESHKDVESRSLMVRLYYRHRLFMGFCCICVEVLYLAAYLLAHEKTHRWAPLSVPPILARSVRGLPVLLAGMNLEDGIPLLAIIAALALPGFVIKQYVNVAQLVNAAERLAQLDSPHVKNSRTPKGRKTASRDRIS